MRSHLPIRLLVCVALAGSAALAAVTGSVEAAAVGHTSLSCSHFAGSNVGGTWPGAGTLSGCTGTALTQTGTGGTVKLPQIGSPSAKVTWSTGKTSILKTYGDAVITNSCPNRPGYLKVLEDEHWGLVTGGTASGLVGVGAVWRGFFCGYKRTATSTYELFVNLGPVVF